MTWIIQGYRWIKSWAFPPKNKYGLEMANVEVETVYHGRPTGESED